MTGGGKEQAGGLPISITDWNEAEFCGFELVNKNKSRWVFGDERLMRWSGPLR